MISVSILKAAKSVKELLDENHSYECYVRIMEHFEYIISLLILVPGLFCILRVFIQQNILDTIVLQ